jgi:2-dehydro-3-deoxyphosphooctonate aldolase (KDO 8-P synthase)
VAALFIETHQDPDHAPSDGPNMLPLADMPVLLQRFKQIDDLIKSTI